MSGRPCPACASERANEAFAARNLREGLDVALTYLRCVECGTLRLDPPSTPALEAAYAAGEVDAVASDPPDAAPTSEPRLPATGRLLRAARRTLFGRPHSWPEEPGRGRRLLDFGCLSGDKLVEFHQRGWNVTGVDLHRAAIAHARARLPGATFHAGALEDLARTEPFDVIRTDNVVEHLSNPLPILRDLRNRLAQDGRLLLYVPNGAALSVRLLRDRSASCWVPFHLQLFTPRGLQALLARAGFTRIHLHGFSPPDWWRLTARQLVAEPGFLRRPPTRRERAAEFAATALFPLLLPLGRTKLAEELVADARL